MSPAIARIFAGLISLYCLLLAQVVHAIQVTDDRGVVVEFVQSPQRIVSVLPSLTEMVCALGACERLVGTDRYSNFPERVRTLPKLGGGLDPNIEAIVALKPDVVLLASSARAAASRLQSLGIQVVALEPKSYADVHRVLDILGKLLAVSDAEQVWQFMNAGVSAAAQSLDGRAKNTRVYFEINSAPYAAGQTSFLGETLTRLGVHNIIPTALGPFPKINPEFVVRANPDVIMVGDALFAGMTQRPGWARMPAIQSGRVCVFTPEQSDVMVRAGPRMAEAARHIAQCLKEKAP